ncbi:uncharacterized protein LOC136035637 [Artemia franciscana]|uniref:Uncharacterized protein n=1 Tax=Artemia franciscana TaxID=6661 RepID=A0AA88LCD5_ARTSF|nr:hypothetical protein QYM36_003342 [Artemia franciscana]KAK2721020.1 hypothetical protein QYM36_003342 [Artemia franciscana]
MLIYAVLILAIGISGIFTADTKNVNDDYDGGIDRDGFYNPYSSLQGKDTYLDPYLESNTDYKSEPAFGQSGSSYDQQSYNSQSLPLDQGYSQAPALSDTYGNEPAKESSYGNNAEGYQDDDKEGVYYYYFPMGDTIKEKLKLKMKGVWDNMLGGATGLSGKLQKHEKHKAKDKIQAIDEAVYGLAAATLAVVIVAWALLLSAPFIYTGLPANLFIASEDSGQEFDLSAFGIPLTLRAPALGKNGGGLMSSSWLTSENIEKVTSYIAQKVDEYRGKVNH